jgi:hypothetical protein
MTSACIVTLASVLTNDLTRLDDRASSGCTILSKRSRIENEHFGVYLFAAQLLLACVKIAGSGLVDDQRRVNAAGVVDMLMMLG